MWPKTAHVRHTFRLAILLPVWQYSICTGKGSFLLSATHPAGRAGLQHWHRNQSGYPAGQSRSGCAGRVFSARRLLTWFPETFTPILGGLLADHIIEPTLLSQTWLSSTFGWLVGTTPGFGMALIMIVTRFLMILTMFTGYLIHSLCNMEDLLPDHEQG